MTYLKISTLKFASKIISFEHDSIKYSSDSRFFYFNSGLSCHRICENNDAISSNNKVNSLPSFIHSWAFSASLYVDSKH